MVRKALSRRALRWLPLACMGAATVQGGAVHAQAAAFDLVGPSIRVSVSHDGVTLPLSQVPNLSAGDRLRITADLPAKQGARYRMVLAFLRGATNPPPKDWLFDVETWKAKKATIDAVVPDGAGQAVLLLVPDTGGAVDAVSSAIRGRPGAFVRASQELNQAMLDRARLETFVDHVRTRDAAELNDVSPQLARSLAVKLDTDCLLRQTDARAACLTQGSNAAVLADGQTSSIAQTLAGTPADIALQLSATPQAGFGYYSPYIGVVRDVARLLGAFQSAQLQFIPALGVPRGELTGLLLNAVPSFRKPQSVLVAALPSVAAATTPPLSVKADDTLCATEPRLVLPVTGAPLVFATDYARQMALRVRGANGVSRDVPATADPVLGGYVVDGTQVLAATAPAGAPVQGTLHGLWGFQPFDGPTFRLVAPSQSWKAAGDASLVVGRDTPLVLDGGAAACVSRIEAERDGQAVPATWTRQGAERIAVKVPLTDAKPGPIAILVHSQGTQGPQRVALHAYAEVARIDGFSLHAGDREGVLTGTRLDQVASLSLAGTTFRPGALDRVASGDRLEMIAGETGALDVKAGQSAQARVALVDGRSLSAKVMVSTPRPAATLVGQSVQQAAPGKVRLEVQGTGLMPQDARLTFSLKAEGAIRFSVGDTVEVEAGATGRTASLPIRLQDAGIAFAELVPSQALGSGAMGPLRFRVVQNGVAGPWRPLIAVVRLPTLDTVRCDTSVNTCQLTGRDLFLISAVGGGADTAGATAVPDGFTGATIDVPRPTTGRLTLWLRDVAGAKAEVRVDG
ncbi:hypothetical protein [Sphingomonas gellani]|nr:hypothetical protein [Sphingomonas gellani]